MAESEDIDDLTSSTTPERDECLTGKDSISPLDEQSKGSISPIEEQSGEVVPSDQAQPDPEHPAQATDKDVIPGELELEEMVEENKCAELDDTKLLLQTADTAKETEPELPESTGPDAVQEKSTEDDEPDTITVPEKANTTAEEFEAVEQVLDDVHAAVSTLRRSSEEDSDVIQKADQRVDEIERAAANAELRDGKEMLDDGSDDKISREMNYVMEKVERTREEMNALSGVTPSETVTAEEISASSRISPEQAQQEDNMGSETLDNLTVLVDTNIADDSGSADLTQVVAENLGEIDADDSLLTKVVAPATKEEEKTAGSPRAESPIRESEAEQITAKAETVSPLEDSGERDSVAGTQPSADVLDSTLSMECDEQDNNLTVLADTNAANDTCIENLSQVVSDNLAQIDADDSLLTNVTDMAKVNNEAMELPQESSSREAEQGKLPHDTSLPTDDVTEAVPASSDVLDNALSKETDEDADNLTMLADTNAANETCIENLSQVVSDNLAQIDVDDSLLKEVTMDTETSPVSDSAGKTMQVAGDTGKADHVDTLQQTAAEASSMTESASAEPVAEQSKNVEENIEEQDSLDNLTMLAEANAADETNLNLTQVMGDNVAEIAADDSVLVTGDQQTDLKSAIVSSTKTVKPVLETESIEQVDSITATTAAVPASSSPGTVSEAQLAESLQSKPDAHPPLGATEARSDEPSDDMSEGEETPRVSPERDTEVPHPSAVRTAGSAGGVCEAETDSSGASDTAVSESGDEKLHEIEEQLKPHSSPSSVLSSQPVSSSTPVLPVQAEPRVSILCSPTERNTRDSVSPGKGELEAIKRIDDLLSSLGDITEKDLDFMSDRTESRMETEEEEDYRDEFDASQLVAFTIEDEYGTPKSYSVDEKFVNTRGRRRREDSQSSQQSQKELRSDSSSLTISTPSSSVESTSSVSELRSMPRSGTVTSATTDDSISLTRLAVADTSDDKVSLDHLIEANATSDDLLDDIEIDAANMVLEKPSPSRKNGQKKDLGVNIKAAQALYNGAPKLADQNGNVSSNNSTVVNSVNTSVDDDSVYYTPEGAVTDKSYHINGDVDEKVKSRLSPWSSPATRHDAKYEVKTLSSDNQSDDQRSVNSQNSGSQMSPAISIKDAKFSFFCSPPQPVRIDPNSLFEDMPWKSKPKTRSNIGKGLELKNGWNVGDSGTPTSPTAAVPHQDTATGENDIFYTPAMSLATRPQQGIASEASPEDITPKNGQLKKSEEVRKRLLPAVPDDKSGSGKPHSLDDIKLRVEGKKQAAKERARLMSDDELGISSKRVVLKEAPPTTSSSGKSSGKSGINIKRPFSGKAGGGRSASVGPRAKSDGEELSSPATDRKGKLKPKSKSFKEGETSEKKDKRRSFLSLFSKSTDKKEKERPTSPPPTTGSKSPPVSKSSQVDKRAKSPQVLEKDLQKTRSLPMNKGKPGKDSSDISSDEKRRSLERKGIAGVKLRTKEKSSQESREEDVAEKRRSMYDEFAPIVEDIQTGSMKSKEMMQERMQQVAPPPAKAPHTALRPPKAISKLETSHSIK